MSVHTTSSRPAARSASAAVLGLVVTLTIFVVAILAFLLAPVLLFGAALAAYLVMRPGFRGTSRSLPPTQPPRVGRSFGAGSS